MHQSHTRRHFVARNVIVVERPQNDRRAWPRRSRSWTPWCFVLRTWPRLGHRVGGTGGVLPGRTVTRGLWELATGNREYEYLCHDFSDLIMISSYHISWGNNFGTLVAFCLTWAKYSRIALKKRIEPLVAYLQRSHREVLPGRQGE